LSLGFGVMITLSSYLDKNEDLVQTAVITAITNTLIAVLAGFMIFPSLFSFGVAPNSGPTLVFQSLPIVFSNMWAGPVFAVIFFSLLLIAALTTSLTIYEVLITTIQEKTKIRRAAAITIVLAGIFIFGNIPSILSYGPWKDISVFGKNIFDAFDYISGNILFMLTALGSALFVGFVMKDEAKDELLYKGNQTTVNIWFAYVKYLVPLVILLIFVSNLF
ncbi:sodium-dependent transporter, partial [Neisseria sp. P0016.S002]